jgi:methionine-rich copper-binding protein CopC
MATIKSNTGDGGSNGTTVTTGNSGGASGDAWGNVVGSTAVTFSNTQTVKGSMAYKMVQVGGTGANVRMDLGANTSEYYGRVYFYFTAFPTSSNVIIRSFDSSFAEKYRFELNASGQIRTMDGSQTLLNTSTALSANAWYRLEWHVVAGTGTSGQIELKVFSLDSTTALITYTNSACNAGTATEHIAFGANLTSPTMPTLYLDEVKFDNAAYIGPANIVNQAPTANAGIDQTVVQGATVTLNGSASSDSDGTITTYAWSQTGGTTVTLSSTSVVQPTFTAPAAPATLTFQLIVTDNGSLTGSDTVVITVGSGSLLYNTAEGGSNSTTLTIANSGGGSGDPWTGLASVTAWTFSNVNKARGSLAYRCAQNVSEAAAVTWDVASLSEYYGRVYFYFTGYGSATQIFVRAWQDDTFTAEAWRLDLLSNGTVRLRDANTNSLYLSTISLTTGVWYRMEWHIVSSTLAGTAELKVFTADQATPLFSYSNTSCNTGAATKHVSFGPGTSTVQLPTMFMDDIVLSLTGWIGVALGTTLNAPPTANAGPDQNASLSSTVTLTGSASSDPDGSITAYSWLQTSGTTVTLSNSAAASPTFTAPSSAGTLVFQLTVTDNSGGTGTDTVTVNVLANIVYQYTAEGGTNGTALTTGNSGGASGNAFTAVTGGTNVWTFSNARSVRGSMSLKCTPLASTPAAVQWQPSSLTEHYGRMYFYISGYAVGAEPLVKAFSGSFVNAWRVELSAGGRLTVRDANSTAIHTASSNVSTGVWYRVEWHVISSASVGQVESRLYVGDQTNTIDSYLSSANINLGANLTATQFGPSQSISTAAPASYYDEMAIGSAAGGWLGIAAGTPLNQPPTANAGVDSIAEPGSTHLLQGSGTDDVSVAGYQWVQLSGPGVNLSDPTGASPSFNVPNTQGGTSLTFGLTVIDDQGLSSAQDTVTITVPTPTLYFAKNGNWTPQP